VLLDSSPLPVSMTAESYGELVDRIVAALGPRAGAATLERVRRVVAAEVDAAGRHRCDRPYDGQVLLIGCTDADPERPAAVLAWRALAPRLRQAELDAGHYDVFDPVHLPALVAALAPVLPAPTASAAVGAAAPTEPSLENAE